MFLSRFWGDFVSMQRKNFNRQKCNTTSSHLKKQFLQSLLFLQKLFATNPNHPICSDGQEASRQLICSAQLENQPDATTVFIYFLLHIYEICLSELHILQNISPVQDITQHSISSQINPYVLIQIARTIYTNVQN